MEWSPTEFEINCHLHILLLPSNWPQIFHYFLRFRWIKMQRISQIECQASGNNKHTARPPATLGPLFNMPSAMQKREREREKKRERGKAAAIINHGHPLLSLFLSRAWRSLIPMQPRTTSTKPKKRTLNTSAPRPPSWRSRPRPRAPRRDGGRAPAKEEQTNRDHQRSKWSRMHCGDTRKDSDDKS